MAFFPLFILSGEEGLLLPYASMSFMFMLISLAYLAALSHIFSEVGIAFRASQSIQSIARKVCGCFFIGFGVKVVLSTK